MRATLETWFQGREDELADAVSRLAAIDSTIGEPAPGAPFGPGPAAALDVMRREMSGLDREMLCVVNQNTRLQAINFNIVSIGDISQSIASIPNILKSGILSNASSFLLLHSHPSGDPTPCNQNYSASEFCSKCE